MGCGLFATFSSRDLTFYHHWRCNSFVAMYWVEFIAWRRCSEREASNMRRYARESNDLKYRNPYRSGHDGKLALYPPTHSTSPPTVSPASQRMVGRLPSCSCPWHYWRFERFYHVDKGAIVILSEYVTSSFSEYDELLYCHTICYEAGLTVFEVYGRVKYVMYSRFPVLSGTGKLKR